MSPQAASIYIMLSINLTEQTFIQWLYNCVIM